MLEYREDIWNELKDFLGDSSSEYGTDLERAKEDLQFYSGNQWYDELKRNLKREKRINYSLSELPKYVQSITSMANRSPYHNTLVPNDGSDKKVMGDIQNAIDIVESTSDYKQTLIKALESDIITGIGIVSLTLVNKNGKTLPYIEYVRDLSTVAFDSNCTTDDMSDAEKGAIVSTISVSKARRLYGNDIDDFSDNDRATFPSQWVIKKDSVPTISYYRMEEDGFCHFYKFVGKYVVESAVLTISRVPLFKLSGYIVFRENKFKSVGIVDRVKDLQVGQNLAYSNLIERLNRSVKAGYICTAESIEGLEDEISKLSDGDVPLFLYKAGQAEPKPLTEAFQTQDLQNVITTSQTMMSQIIGVPQAGVQGIMQLNSTATEAMLNQQNAESNVSCFYQSLSLVSKQIGECIECLTLKSIDLPYQVKVVDGPDVINRNAKKRQQILQMVNMMPENLKPLIAKYFSECLDDDIGDDMSRQISANLDPNIRIVGENDSPEAYHIMNQSKMVIDDLTNKLSEALKNNSQLQNEVDTLNVELLNNREQRQLELAKMIMENERQATKDAVEAELKAYEMGIKETDVKNKFILGAQKAKNEATNAMLDIVKENDKIIEESVGMTPSLSSAELNG